MKLNQVEVDKLQKFLKSHGAKLIGFSMTEKEPSPVILVSVPPLGEPENEQRA